MSLSSIVQTRLFYKEEASLFKEMILERRRQKTMNFFIANELSTAVPAWLYIGRRYGYG
jgi:hypothetical protein